MRFPRRSGRNVKADLIDVSGGEAVVKTSIVFEGNSSTEALNNSKIINFLQEDEDTLKIAFPLVIRTAINDKPRARGLQLLEINNITTEATLSDAGMLRAETGERVGRSQGYSRGLIHDEAIYFAHARAVWSAFWDTPDQTSGPILENPELCNYSPPSLTLNITLPDESTASACDYYVNTYWNNSLETLAPTPAASGNACSFTSTADFDSKVLLEGSLFGFSDIQHWVSFGAQWSYCNVGNHAIINSIPNEVDTTECEAISRPSFAITVQTDDGNTDVCNTDVSVYQDQVRFHLTPLKIEVNTQCLYEGPFDVEGVFSIEAKLDGYETYMQHEFYIEEDNCGVLTEPVSITLPTQSN